MCLNLGVSTWPSCMPIFVGWSAVSPLRSRMTSPPPPRKPGPQEGWWQEGSCWAFSPPPPGSVHLQQLWRVKNSPGASGSGRGRGTRGGRAEGGRHPRPSRQRAGVPGPRQHSEASQPGSSRAGHTSARPHLRGFGTPALGLLGALLLRKRRRPWGRQPGRASVPRGRRGPRAAPSTCPGAAPSWPPLPWSPR